MSLAHSYQFTTDWFSGNIPCLEHFLRHYVDQEGLRILEIGSWEGRSTTWFLTFLPHATITCVDTFEGGVEHATMNELGGIEDRFRHNLRPFSDRVTIRKGNSKEVLFGMEPDSFDVIYVDGSHEAPDVLCDVIMSFMLFKQGGIMLMDDYAANDVITEDQRLHHAKASINTFLDIFQEKIEVLHIGYQVYIRKTKS